VRRARWRAGSLRGVYSFLWSGADWMPDWLLEHGWDRMVAPVLWLGCKVLGHEEVADMCGLLEHRYCIWCQRSMPGAKLSL